ncbi:MAG: hypothetical protein F6K47_26110 [Symploca sp. SIO2E6]|nr:hypothetical protein [Symploca sp. SIO2E6]
MIWTYRVFCDNKGHYSIREVFSERDGQLIAYGKSPVAVLGNSPEELRQLIQWCKEAFELPVLSLEEVDAQIAALPASSKAEHSQNVSLQQVMTELDIHADSVV